LNIKFLGTHNAESKDSRLVTLLIDDVLAIDAGCLTSELTFKEQEKIKEILLSHGHYDHIRDIPSFAFNNVKRTTKIFATPETLRILSTHLADGVIYPRFTKKIPLFLEKPSLKYVSVEPFSPIDVEGYQVLPLPVNHTIRTIGYEITSEDGKKMFYSGDTGPGLSALWDNVSPDLIVVETTFSNRLENRAKNSSHLCPKKKKKELIEFHRVKGYYPKIFLIHLSPKYEDEIKKEVNEISKELKISINIAHEGDKIKI